MKTKKGLKNVYVLVYAAMLAAKNIITAEDADQLIAGLEGILADIDSGKLPKLTFNNDTFGMSVIYDSFCEFDIILE